MKLIEQLCPAHAPPGYSRARTPYICPVCKTNGASQGDAANEAKTPMASLPEQNHKIG